MGDEALNITFDDGEEEVTEPMLEEAPESPDAPEEQEAEDKPEEQEEAEEGKIEFTPEQQAKVDEIARKAASRNLDKLREIDEERQRLSQQLEQFQSRQQQDPQRPNIPPVPDPFSDDFEQKMQEREQAIQEAVRYDTFQQLSQQQAEQQARAQQQQQQEALEKTVTSYNNRAKKLGIKADELAVAGRQIAAVGMAPELVEHLLNDQQGPSVTVYLANNLDELDKIHSMSPIQAAIYMETQVKPKAAARRKPVAPEPTDSPRGSGLPEKLPGSEGILYE